MVGLEGEVCSSTLLKRRGMNRKSRACGRRRVGGRIGNWGEVGVGGVVGRWRGGERGGAGVGLYREVGAVGWRTVGGSFCKGNSN